MISLKSQMIAAISHKKSQRPVTITHRSKRARAAETIDKRVNIKVVHYSKYGDVQEKFHFLENTRCRKSCVYVIKTF